MKIKKTYLGDFLRITGNLPPGEHRLASWLRIWPVARLA